MSHASSSSTNLEPNLVPLLDMVLQLIMFFMMCANFASAQVDKSIKLPVMQSARPEDKRESDLFYLNLRKDGTVEMLGKPPMKKAAEIKTALRDKMNDTKRAQGTDKTSDVKTIIVLRADENVEYRDVFQLMYWCKEIGFRKFQIRAQTRAEAS